MRLLRIRLRQRSRLGFFGELVYPSFIAGGQAYCEKITRYIWRENLLVRSDDACEDGRFGVLGGSLRILASSFFIKLYRGAFGA
jgi:hypothetical protein